LREVGGGRGHLRRRDAELCQAEIENLDGSATSQKDVRGFDVAMNDLLGMRRIQSLGNLNCDWNRLSKFERPARDARGAFPLPAIPSR